MGPAREDAVSAPRASVFGPLALIGAGVALLVHNLWSGVSLWTLALDRWPWFLVAWGLAHVAQHLLARARGGAGPRRLGAGAIVVALLICLAGQTGRAIRANDGVLFRAFGGGVQVREPAFRSPPPSDPAAPTPVEKTP